MHAQQFFAARKEQVTEETEIADKELFKTQRAWARSRRRHREPSRTVRSEPKTKWLTETAGIGQGKAAKHDNGQLRTENRDRLTGVILLNACSKSILSAYVLCGKRPPLNHPVATEIHSSKPTQHSYYSMMCVDIAPYSVIILSISFNRYIQGR